MSSETEIVVTTELRLYFMCFCTINIVLCEKPDLILRNIYIDMGIKQKEICLCSIFMYNEGKSVKAEETGGEKTGGGGG